MKHLGNVERIKKWTAFHWSNLTSYQWMKKTGICVFNCLKELLDKPRILTVKGQKGKAHSGQVVSSS